MLQIVEVKTRKQRKEFVEYPLRMYKGNPYFVPPLYGDEMKMFTKKNIYFRTCQSVFYLAQRDGVTVGRIQGIVNVGNHTERIDKGCCCRNYRKQAGVFLENQLFFVHNDPPVECFSNYKEMNSSH